MQVEEMTVEMMERTAAQWAEAAWVCKSLGFQMVNLHGGHGWLLNQFLSPGSTTAPTSSAAAWPTGPGSRLWSATRSRRSAATTS